MDKDLTIDDAMIGLQTCCAMLSPGVAGCLAARTDKRIIVGAVATVLATYLANDPKHYVANVTLIRDQLYDHLSGFLYDPQPGPAPYYGDMTPQAAVGLLQGSVELFKRLAPELEPRELSLMAQLESALEVFDARVAEESTVQ